MRHRFHAICPYFAMFPEAFAEKWIKRLTREGETILDPFCGRGTTAFTAALAERRSISCDTNDVAYCITKAKLQPPCLRSLKARVTKLHKLFRPTQWVERARTCPEFFQFAFSESTLAQILFLREYLDWRNSRTDTMLAALMLGSLHGDSGSNYLSNQMPRTISTKPGYSIKFWQKRKLEAPERDVFELLRERAEFRYETPPPLCESLVVHSDMRRLFTHVVNWKLPIRCVITSPPYLDVTNFEEDQWLRLWFLGGPPFPTTSRLSKDNRHVIESRYWSFIADMWSSLGSILSSDAHIVIRLGSRKLSPSRLSSMLTSSSFTSQRRVCLISKRVSIIQRRQTDAFHPGTKGCSFEVDCHFVMK